MKSIIASKNTDKKLDALTAKPREHAAVIRADDGYVYRVLPLDAAVRLAADRIARWHRPFVVATCAGVK